MAKRANLKREANARWVEAVELFHETQRQR